MATRSTPISTSMLVVLACSNTLATTTANQAEEEKFPSIAAIVFFCRSNVPLFLLVPLATGLKLPSLKPSATPPIFATPNTQIMGIRRLRIHLQLMGVVFGGLVSVGHFLRVLYTFGTAALQLVIHCFGKTLMYAPLSHSHTRTLVSLPQVC